MQTKLLLNPGYLGLFTLASWLMISPSQAQTVDVGVKNSPPAPNSGGVRIQSPPAPNPGGVQIQSPPAPNPGGVRIQSPPELGDLGGSPRPRVPASPIAQLPPLPQDIIPQRPSETLPEQEPVEATPPTEEFLLPPTPDSPEPIPGEVPQTIIVEGFEFEGNTIIPDEELAEATKDFLNRPLPFAEVFEVRSVITKLYRERGYVTSGAIIPPQVFEGGVVKVQVIEGELETITITGTQRLNQEYIRSRLALGAGVPLNRDELIEALQKLQLDPLIANISAELGAGTRPGSSVLSVQVEEAQTFFIDLSLNNSRSPTIGTFERKATLTQANLLGDGDGFSISYGNTDGSNTIDASYTYPLNPRNGTLGVRFNTSFSHVIEPPFNRVDIDSDAQYLEFTWRQPLWQNLAEEFALGLSATFQDSKVTIFDEPIDLSPGAEDGSTTVNALRFFQEWTQRSNTEVFSLRSQFNIGLGILGATVNDSGPDSTFLSWRGQTQWVSLIAPETLLILQGDMQFATQSLLRLEQFGIGGADTVRGYRQNTFLTDNGLLASAEVRIPIVRLPELEGLLQIAPFVDFGTIWNHSGNPDPDPDPNVLVSTGIGLRLRLGDRLSARFDWGIPLVDVPTSDRTLQEEGLYFSLTYRVY
ncbi:MAG: BamA/TamA family outer membrane protein [Symploca sp. SIO2D2]|nr:BamA/TamA family outer membrane protein [Symploca sp. SIO2D2]